jgi:phosphorylated CTD-interacting factor 1
LSPFNVKHNARYDLFGDAVKNCQLAISSDAFVKMSDDFGVTHECFATPLTRICASYNSIFPDSDRYFGSLGSFFDFMPVEGSFFVNPPYGFNIKMTLEHIISILKSSDSDKNALR